MTELLDALRGSLATGRKILVPYVMGGIPDRTAFAEVLATLEPHADALEVGLPFSDPLMDGPVIAAAGERAIAAGIGPRYAVDITGASPGRKPRIAMTYYNPVHRLGEAEFCSLLARNDFRGLIVPDLPVEESRSLREAAASSGLAWIPLVAPTSSPARVAAIAATATGFVYAVSTLGVTGAREALSERAARVVELVRAETDLPVLVGIGISTPQQARDAAGFADGVVVGSAIVRAVMEQGPEAAGRLLGELRGALDDR